MTILTPCQKLRDYMKSASTEFLRQIDEYFVAESFGEKEYLTAAREELAHREKARMEENSVRDILLKAFLEFCDKTGRDPKEEKKFILEISKPNGAWSPEYLAPHLGHEQEGLTAEVIKAIVQENLLQELNGETLKEVLELKKDYSVNRENKYRNRAILLLMYKGYPEAKSRRLFDVIEDVM